MNTVILISGLVSFLTGVVGPVYWNFATSRQKIAKPVATDLGPTTYTWTKPRTLAKIVIFAGWLFLAYSFLLFLFETGENLVYGFFLFQFFGIVCVALGYPDMHWTLEEGENGFRIRSWVGKMTGTQWRNVRSVSLHKVRGGGVVWKWGKKKRTEVSFIAVHAYRVLHRFEYVELFGTWPTDAELERYRANRHNYEIPETFSARPYSAYPFGRLVDEIGGGIDDGGPRPVVPPALFFEGNDAPESFALGRDGAPLVAAIVKELEPRGVSVGVVVEQWQEYVVRPFSQKEWPRSSTLALIGERPDLEAIREDYAARESSRIGEIEPAGNYRLHADFPAGESVLTVHV